MCSYVCWLNCAGGRLGDGAADYVGGDSSIFEEVEDEVQQQEEQDYGVGKRVGGTSWKFGEEIMEEVEEFKYRGELFHR